MHGPETIYPLRWVAVGPRIAAACREIAGRPHLEAVVVYAPTAVEMRDLRMSDLLAAWRQFAPVAGRDGETPPTEAETAELFARNRDGGAVARARIESITDGLNELRSLGPLARRDGETPDQFYRRVAAAWQALSKIGDQPTKDLARIADVKYGTASSWVSHARKRGFLE